MEEKKELMFEVMYERDGVGINVLSDEEFNDLKNRDFDYDDYLDNLNWEDVGGSWIMIGNCSSLLREYINVGDDDFKDDFLEWLMEYKDIDIDWDEDDEKKLIRVCFDGDVEKMKNWKKKEERLCY